ncbi:MAG: hypothetical protein AAF226_04820 [Verrucomicrobiota bacterium]
MSTELSLQKDKEAGRVKAASSILPDQGSIRIRITGHASEG